MKRIKQIDGVELYDLICSEDNIREAIKLACKDHAKDPAVIKIREDPEPYVQAVSEILRSESFHYSRFKEKDIFERGKHRHLLFTRTFPDRIIQHAVFNIVAPILHGTIIITEYAQVKERGTHKCSIRVHNDLNRDWQHTWYCLKIDVSHFFDNVDRNILFNMIKRKIKCPRTLDILHTIIFDVPGKKGLPIGLFSSQILSVFYLSQLDHYCKETLGIKYYYRYMDDIVILASNKILLHNYLRLIKLYVRFIGLSLKKNYAIFPIEKRRLDFVGFVFTHSYVALRKSTKIRYIRACNNIIRTIKYHEQVTVHQLLSVNSYVGILTWVSDDKLFNKYNGRIERVIAIGVEAI